MTKHELLLAACAFMAIPMANAQDAAGVPESAGTVDSIATISLHAIEVSALRATQNTPVAQTTISKKQLEKSNDGRDLPFLLSMTPSVVTTSDAGAGVGYCGIRVRGTDASRINVMANGVPINDSESHNVYWVNMPDLVSSLRDVQIQRGAGTSVNGAGAFGASINMVTDAPQDEPYAVLSGAYGSFNTHKETISLGTGLLGDHWTIDARLSNIGSDGYLRRASSDLWSYLGQVAYSRPGTNIRLLAFGGKESTYMAWDYASREQMALYGRRYNPCGEYIDGDGNVAYYPDQKDIFTQHHFQLHLSQRINDRWHLSAALFYTKGDGYYDQYKQRRTLVEYGLEPFYDAEGNKIKKSDLIRLKYNDNGFGGANVNANYSYGRLDLSIGGSANQFNGRHFGRIKWVRDYINTTHPLDPLQEYYNNTGKKFDANIYARANVAISRPFSAFADMQYRHIDYKINGITDNYDYNIEALAPIDIHRKWDFFNPKVGVNFTDSVHHRAFASWSVAHREPVRDNFTDGDRRHDPDAERMFDYELGYTYSHPLFSLGVNLYYMDYKDQLVLTGQLSDTGNALSVNVPCSYRMGIELQGALRPCSWFDWEINATLSRNRIKDFTEWIYDDAWENDPLEICIGSTPIAFSPSVTAKNAFNFNHRGFEASLLTQYVGKQYLSNVHSDEQMLKAYCVSDLELGYDFAKGCSRFTDHLGVRGLRIGFIVHNLFNARYENNGYAYTYYLMDGHDKPVIYRESGYAAQAGTNVMGTVTVKF